LPQQQVIAVFGAEPYSLLYCMLSLLNVCKNGQAVKKVCGPKKPGCEIKGRQEMAVIIIQWQKF